MARCMVCGSDVLPKWTYCSCCGNKLSADALAGGADEASYIDYVLRALPWWLHRGWVNRAGADSIARDLLSRQLRATSATRVPAPAEAVPVAPPLVSSSVPGPAPVAEAPAAPPATPPRSAVPAPGTPWIAEFLSAQWLRLLAVLSVAFILVGVRQILGWEWVSAIALQCVPLLPITLTVVLIRVGLRYREESRTGAFAAVTAGTVLSAFAVFSVNKHWLSYAIPTVSAETAGIVLATGVAVALRIRLDDRALNHLVYAGLTAAVLDGIRAYTGLALFDHAVAPEQAVAMMALAAGALLMARRAHEDARLPDLVWAHALCTLGAFRAAFAFLAPGQPGNSAIVVLALAATGYSVAARWFPGAGTPFGASGYIAATLAALVARSGFGEAYLFSMTLSLAGLHALAFSRLPAPQGSGALSAAESRRSFDTMAVLSACFAGAIVLYRSSAGWLGVYGLAAVPWGQACAASVLCAGVFVGTAAAIGVPGLLVPACVAWVIALVHAGEPVLEGVPFSWGYLVLPGAVTLLAAGVAMRRLFTGERGALWSRSVILSGCYASAIAAAGMVTACDQCGVTDLLWVEAGVLAAVTACCAGLLFNDDDRTVSQFCAVVGAAAVTILPGLCGYTIAADLGDPFTGVSVGMLAISAVWGAGMVRLAYRSPDHSWLGVLSAATIATATLASFGRVWCEHPPWTDGLLPASCAAVLIVSGAAGSSRVCLWAGILPVVIGWFSIADEGFRKPIGIALVTMPMAVAVLYSVVAAWKRDPVVLRQVVVCVLVVALTAFIVRGCANGKAASELAAVFLLAACAGMLTAAHWSARFGYSVAGGLFGVTGYIRLVTIGWACEWAWAAVIVLPAVVTLLVAGALLPGDRAVMRRPLFGVAAVVSAVALVVTLVASADIDVEHQLAASVAFACYALVAGVMAQSEEALESALRIVALGLLAAGWVAALPMNRTAADARTAAECLCVASFILAGLLTRAAAVRMSDFDSAASTVCAGLGALALLGGVIRLEPCWLPAALLPVWIALTATSAYLPERLHEAVGVTVERSSAVLAFLTSVGATSLYIAHPEIAPVVLCGSLLAYGVAECALLAWRREPEYTVLASVTLTAGAVMGAHAFGAREAALGAAISAIGAAWSLAQAWTIRFMEDDGRHAKAVYGLSSFLAGVGALVALWYVAEPEQGKMTVLALLLSGAGAFTQYLAGRGAGYGHAGALSCFVAWSLVVYDSFRPNMGALDFYLIPVGLYLVLLGYLAGARRSSEQAAVLWWLGLLTTITPSFVAFYVHHVNGGTPLHALLLVVECVGAILWGIRERIKAFVYCGTVFAAGFVLVLGGGAVMQLWSGLLALMLGIALLAFVLYVSLHRRQILDQMERLGIEWDDWR